VLKATNLRVIATGDMLQYNSCLRKVSRVLIHNDRQEQVLSMVGNFIFGRPEPLLGFLIKLKIMN